MSIGGTKAVGKYELTVSGVKGRKAKLKLKASLKQAKGGGVALVD